MSALPMAVEQPNKDTPSVQLLRGDQVRMEAVRWLWRGFLPAGKFVILGGAPSCGKTTIAMALAAVVTSAGRWPDGWPCRDAGDVLIWSGEDDPATTLAPRLKAAGADMHRVHFVQGVSDGDAFDPARDMPLLEAEAAKLTAPRLLVIDPIVSAVAGDNHRNNEVRRSLQSVVDMADRLGCTVIGIHHFSKGTQGREVTERISGSLAYAALARMVLVAAKEQAEGDEPPRRIFVRAKSNLGPDGGGFAYALEQVEVAPGIFGQRIGWGETLQGEARDLLAVAETPTDTSEGSALSDAEGFLRDLLKDGAVPSKQVMADAREAGYSAATIRRAKDALGVKPKREGGAGKDGMWTWALPLTPPKVLKESKDAQEKLLSTLGKFEHLSQNDGTDAPDSSDDESEVL